MEQRAFIVGVAGGSGSGKTTLVRALRDHLPADSVCLLSQDDYYRPIDQQVKDANGKVNFDLPGALDLDRMAEDLRCLSEGGTVTRKEYTFNMPGAAAEWLVVRPARVILVEGLFLFQHSGIRELLDLKVFVDASEEVQLHRRLARDQRERGYGVDAIRYQWDHHVMPAYREHLLPYRSLCDIRIMNENRYEEALSILRERVLQGARVPERTAQPA